MSVHKTLTEAINAQPATVVPAGTDSTSSTYRDVPYAERYRESTSVRETPVQRLMRVVDTDATSRER